MLLHSLPLRWIIPFLILIFGGIASAISYVNSVAPAMARVEAEHERDIALILGQSQGTIETDKRIAGSTNIQRYISSFGANESIKSILLLNREGVVTESTNLAHIGKHQENMAFMVEQGIIAQAKQGRNSVIQFSASRSEIYGIIGICGPSEENSLRSLDCGYLYIVDSLLSDKSQTVGLLRSQAKMNTFGILLAAILLSLYFRWMLMSRVQKLLSVTKDFKAGNIDSRSELTGKDELAKISQAMDNMLSQISNSQRELEKTLHDLEGQKYVLDHHALVVVTDKAGKITYVNDKFCKISGYSRKELLGINPRILKSGEHSKAFYIDMWETISCGNVWHGEVCNKAKDGSLYWLETTIAPLTNAKGLINQYIAVRTDVTGRKRTEEELRQTHKMKAIGQLTGGIAHDFNNILAIIMGNLEILQMQLKDEPKLLKRLNTASKGAKRGADLTKKLLGFSRTTTSETEITSINKSIQHLDELIEKSLTVSVTLEMSLAEKLWPVDINKGDLEDALLNLALNARDAMPDGGTLSIKTTNIILDKEHSLYNLDNKTQEFVMITLSDTGIGMSEKTLEKAIEPFFTTKAVHTGTGLGLSMVHGFVERSGGHLVLDSKLGHGSKVSLYLPRAVYYADGLGTQLPERKNVLPMGSETILVVDDEKSLTELAEINLTKLGYEVITTEKTFDALKIIQSNQKIDLLFSDIVMPGDIDGFELAHNALDIKPTLKILLTSGYAKKSVKNFRDHNSITYQLAQKLLAKPYNHTDLAHAVRKTLDYETENTPT